MAIVSYAQCFEDVMLARAFADVPCGIYVDIGAQDPVVDSVSKAFYDMGWRGLHVEPCAQYAALLREARPDEIVLEVLVGTTRGLVPFFEIPETGLSTGIREIAEAHATKGLTPKQRLVPCVTLEDVFSQFDVSTIHWMKIDVEGYESKVIEGWPVGGRRPWVVLIESTFPASQVESHAEWDPRVRDLGYVYAYFDGLNRFYVSEEHRELLDAFKYGPTVFDGFSLSGTASSSFAALLNGRIENFRKDLVSANEEHAKAVAELQERVSASESLRVEVEKRSRVELEDFAGRQAALDEELRSCQRESLRLTQAMAARERDIVERMRVNQQEALALNESRAAREAELRRELEAGREEVLRLSQVLLATEQNSIQQLQSAQSDLIRLSEDRAARERELVEDLSESRREVMRLSRALTSKERELDSALETSAHESRRLSESLSSLAREVEARNIELAMMRTSASWRLTYPLRWFNRVLDRLRG